MGCGFVAGFAGWAGSCVLASAGWSPEVQHKRDNRPPFFFCRGWSSGFGRGTFSFGSSPRLLRSLPRRKLRFEPLPMLSALGFPASSVIVPEVGSAGGCGWLPVSVEEPGSVPVACFASEGAGAAFWGLLVSEVSCNSRDEVLGGGTNGCEVAEPTDDMLVMIISDYALARSHPLCGDSRKQCYAKRPRPDQRADCAPLRCLLPCPGPSVLGCRPD